MSFLPSSFRSALLLLPAAALLQAQEPAPTPEGHVIPAALQRERTNHTSISASRQFVVHGPNGDLCTLISRSADEIRKNLYDILKVPNEWKYKIGIRLYGAPGSPVPASPVRMGITLIGDEPNFLISVHIGQRFDKELMTNAITTMLLYEMTLRHTDIEALPEEVRLPAWLLYGVEEAMHWKTDEAERSKYVALFESNEILQPDEILSRKNPREDMDATTFEAYKASCGALAMCLLNQKGGDEAMMRVLSEAISGNDDPQHLIKRNFPLLTLTPSSLHKWWTLQMSTMATAPLTEAMTIQDTERRLNEILLVMKYNPESRTTIPLSLDNLADVLATPNLDGQLRMMTDSLVHLSNRCFPTYRPIVAEYTRIIASVRTAKSDAATLQKRLDAVGELRALSLKSALRTRDYLDWYEISTKTTLSPTFDSYLHTMGILRRPPAGLDTPISHYLDDIEKLYTLPASAPTPLLVPQAAN